MGRVAYGTDVEKWCSKGAGNFYLACSRMKKNFIPFGYTHNAKIFMETSNLGEKHETNFDPLTRPPSWPLAAGPSACHLSSVTCHSRGGGLAGVGGALWTSLTGRGVLKGLDFFLVKDRPYGPPQGTINRQPPTANRRQPPTASGDHPPTTNHCQPPSTTNPQPPTAANHHQPPPTASRQLPTANT